MCRVHVRKAADKALRPNDWLHKFQETRKQPYQRRIRRIPTTKKKYAYFKTISKLDGVGPVDNRPSTN